MRWEDLRRSTNVEDRRGFSGGVGLAGGGIGAVAVVIIALLFGIDPSILLQGDYGPTQTQETRSGEPDEMREFVSAVLADTEDTWTAIFRQANADYREPTLVLFSGAVQSACGFAQAAMGPFYCPGDQRVYLDTSFFRDLQTRFRAPGDFAQAYVIAHEVGHHVQTLMGISRRVGAQRERLSPAEANALSVRVELQADCFAGIWAFHADRTRNILDAGDIDEALTAASAIGDDRLQRQAHGRVVPDSFTHGSSAQRVRWFRHGYESGRVSACDTFKAERL